MFCLRYRLFGPKSAILEKEMRKFILLTVILVWWLPWGYAADRCSPQPRVVVEGQLVEIRHPIALIKGENGQIYRIRLGPYWFWKERGYHLREGTRVKVVGIQKGKLIFPIAIETPKTRLFIRDECGLPLWRRKP